MISKIIATDFKGLSFDQELGKYNLFLGKNGSGKSARTEALCIAILGYNPRDAQKRTGDIYHTHSAGKEWSVGATIGDQTITRVFSNGSKVSQDILMGGKKLKGNQVEAALVRAGDPKIFDLSAFMGLSDNKKLEYLFDLFPPEEDVSEIEARLANLGQKESSLSEKQKGAEAIIGRLAKEKADVQLSGTLAEIQADIKNKEDALSEAENQLNEIKVQEREEAARLKAEEEAKTKEEVAEKKAEERIAAMERQVAELKIRPETHEDGQGGKIHTYPPEDSVSPQGSYPGNKSDISHDLIALKETMEKTGCEICAAMIQLKGLIRKHKGGK